MKHMRLSFRYISLLSFLILFFCNPLCGQSLTAEKENVVVSYKLNVFPNSWCQEHSGTYYYQKAGGEDVDSCKTLDTIYAYLVSRLERHFGYVIGPLTMDSETGRVLPKNEHGLRRVNRKPSESDEFNRMLKIKISYFKTINETNGHVGPMVFGNTRQVVVIKIQEFDARGVELSKYRALTNFNESTPVRPRIVLVSNGLSCSNLTGNQLFEIFTFTLEKALNQPITIRDLF
jgi:hypothetical protein